MIHEWICGEAGSDTRARRWQAPHSLFIHLAHRAIQANDASDSCGVAVWIGRRAWPQARALGGFTPEIAESALWIFDLGFWKASQRPWTHAWSSVVHHSRPLKSWAVPSIVNSPSIQNPEFKIQDSLLPRSIFIDPPDDASRVWAIDLALRSSAADVVIADGSKLKMAESRRLQLAAARGRALGLLARPSWEGAELSAAATRWRVRRTPSPSHAPRWIVELLRCKQFQGRSGLQVSSAVGACGRDGGMGAWEVEYGAPGCVHLVADVVDRSGSPPAQARDGGCSLFLG
jgi:hypothetical protein